MNPLLQQALKQGIFKDIWGETWQGFMGIGGDGEDSGALLDNPQGRNTAFAADVSIYRCVDIRGASIASVPLKVYDSQDPDTRKEVQHEALDVLGQANPFNWVSGPDLLRYSLGSRDLHGNFAWSIVYDRGGRLRGPVPRELYWLPPAQYKPVAGADLDPPQPKVPFAGLKVRRKTKSASGEVFLPADQVVYAPTFSPIGDLRGTSKITALRMDLNLRIAGQNSNWWFFQNNQRPDVVVTGAFSPTTENVNFMRRIWKAAFGGDKNRGPAFLPQDMKVQLLTMASKDAEWLGQRHSAREDILAAFGVPPPVYGDLSRATYENIRTAYQHFWQEGMIADMDQMSAVLTYQFLRRWPDALKAKLWMCFDYSQIEALQEDANAIWERSGALIQRVQEMVAGRMLLPNQARPILQSLFKMIGLPDAPFAGQVPGGDMFYVKLQDIPVIEASVQASIDTNAARAGTTNGETNKPGNGKWILPDAPPAPLPAGPGSPQPSAPTPASQPPAKVIVHNHLTRLELPGPPGLPEPPRQALVTPDVIRARDWLTRRLKRHFQDQQTAALRALRAAQEVQNGDEAVAYPSELWDGRAGHESARDTIQAALDMAGLQGDAERMAGDVEGATRQLVALAMGTASDRGPSDYVRAAFKHSIEERAALIAQAVVDGQREEDVA